MSHRSSLYQALTLMAAGALLTGCGGKGAAPAGATTTTETPPSMIGPENLFVVESSQLQNGPTISGTLTPERAATIRAEINSTVVQTLVDEGQPVRLGQLLGRLKDDAVADQVLSARSAVRTADEAVVVARRNAERTEKLARAGAVAERELEQARWSVTNAEGGLADAKARLAAAEKALGYTELRSPISGIVSERQVNAGDNVSSGNPLFTVVDPSSLRLEAQVPVTAIATLKVGTPVPFSIDGYDDRQFEGRVTRINPAVDPTTRQVRITVALPNKAGRLVSGLFAQGRVAIETRVGLVVPTSAIDRRDLRPTATRIEGGVAKRVEVVLGIEDQTLDRVEITSGLAPGDTVVIGAARSIQPGTRVRPAAPAERTRSATSN
jgi:RND family efflux transporter MFP subunit